MESRAIEDDQITGSSFDSHTTWGKYEPWEGRLNNIYNHFWSTETKDPEDPWIQVNMSQQTVVKGIITQGGAGGYDQWVTELQIQYGESEDTMSYIRENGKPIVSTFTSVYITHNVRPMTAYLLRARELSQINAHALRCTNPILIVFDSIKIERKCFLSQFSSKK